MFHTYMYKPYWFSWVVIFATLFGCHDAIILDKSPIKWRQRPDMAIAVSDWDVKHQLKRTSKQTNKQTNKQVHEFLCAFKCIKYI